MSLTREDGRLRAAGYTDLMEIDRPFIRLPYTFDAALLAAEVSRLPDDAWMTHPAGFKGNSAVPLVSRDGGMNDDFHGAMRPTPHLRQCPYLQQAMAAFGEVLGRSRLMKLAGGAEVATHVDFNYHWYTRVRIHVPVVTNAEVVFHCGGERLYMRAGECWIFNSWRRHRVSNESNSDRIHLVIDVAGSSRFWAMVREMAGTDPDAGCDTLARKARAVVFDPEGVVDVLTENYNISPVMSPGELDALVRELIADFSANKNNRADLVTAYKSLLTDFAKDWREIWHLYGYRRDGQPRYEAAIENLRRQLHPDNRALTTQSNGVGVNPIVVQRILNSALATDQLDRFTANNCQDLATNPTPGTSVRR